MGVIQIVPEDNLCNFFLKSHVEKGEHGLVQ